MPALPAPTDSSPVARVLCATDFSDSAAAAVEVAVALARPRQAEIRILHVQPAPVLPGRPMSALSRRPGASDQTPEDVMQALHRCRQTAIDGGVAAEGVLRQGEASEEIVGEATHMAADLIVMGRHSKGASNPWILGSVAERVLRRAPCPVIVVRPFARPGQGRRRVVCGLDLGETSTATLAYAAVLAKALEGDLLALHVVPEGGDVAAARRGVAAAVGKLAAMQERVQERVVAGVPHQEIVAAAREDGAAFVVVGSHGGGIVERQFLGSTTLHLLREAECPVLVVPAHVTQTAEQPAPPVAPHVAPGSP